ncbi:MAG TPA: type 1 glutamine amidotransferase [Candidatus Cybelea sp.]|nr:type 1 glutamine amidotransferase [Candidatus Cybelea sp.]
MTRFLIIVPEVAAPPGLIGEALLELGHAYDAIYPRDRFASHAPLAYPGMPATPGDYRGLIVMGGPMSANDIEDFPFLAETMALIRAFDADQRPVLGVCLGAQIIAKALGGEVFPMGRLEAGYVAMQTTEHAEGDPVFAGLSGGFQAFHTHYEAVRNIAGATVLASGGASAVQAFRSGKKTYGLQFHPEVTLDIARDWVRKFGEAFCQDEPRLITDLDRDFGSYFAGSSRLCRVLVKNWVALA